MAHTNFVVSVMVVLFPIAALADVVDKVTTAKGVPPPADVITTGYDALPSTKPDRLAISAVPDEDGIWLTSNASSQPNTVDCLRPSGDLGRPTGCLSRTASVIPDLKVEAKVGPAGADLKLFLLAAIVLGGLWYFLTSPDYAALWIRLFGPLDWD